MKHARSEDAARRLCADLLVGRTPTAAADDPALAVDALLTTARDQGVVVLLADALAARDPGMPVPAGLREALRAEVRLEAMRELVRTLTAVDVVDALAAAGIDALALKGTALAHWLYVSPMQRPSCDVDLLVSDLAAAEAAVACLEARGYRLLAEVRPAAAADYEVALANESRGGYAVDLHWRLANHARLASGLGFAELAVAAIPLPELHPGARGLGRAHALLHALLHRMANAPSGTQDRLIWLYDIHLLAGGCDAATWEAFVRCCGEKGFATPCLDGLRACRAALGTAVPGEVEARLQALSRDEVWDPRAALERGAMNRAHLRALRWPERLGWLRRKLFPSRAFMRHRYGAAGALALARAYLQRWWVGLRRALGG